MKKLRKFNIQQMSESGPPTSCDRLLSGMAGARSHRVGQSFPFNANGTYSNGYSPPTLISLPKALVWNPS